MLTQEILKEEFLYDPVLGEFWRLKKRSTSNMGVPAGYVQKRGNIAISVLGKAYKAHRLAWLYMTGDWPKDQIDHINGDPTDNRWSNLREVDNMENTRNVGIPKNNTSGVMGVWWHKQNKKWCAEIKVNYKKISLGLYKTIEEAAAARKEAERHYGFHENHGRKNNG